LVILIDIFLNEGIFEMVDIGYKCPLLSVFVIDLCHAGRETAMVGVKSGLDLVLMVKSK
jgi:hypothetical protein